MFRSFVSLLTLIMMSGILVFGATGYSQEGPPPRGDYLDMHSKQAQIKLARAESILKTLVPDPQSYQLILSNTPSIGAEAVPPHVYSDKPTMIIYQGTLAPARTNQELAFVMAHELGHLNLHHSEKGGMRMEKIFSGSPAEISGINFAIFYQKVQEQEADMYGLALYEHAGYDLNFFSHTLKLIKINPNIHFGTPHVFRKARSSLSLKDSHYSMLDRFELLSAVVKAQASPAEQRI